MFRKTVSLNEKHMSQFKIRELNITPLKLLL
jgi:hypothetical protein